MAIDFPFFSFYTFFVCWASIEFILLEATWCCFVWVIQRKEGFYGLYFTFSCTSLCCLPHFFFFFCLTIFFIESHALLRKFLICFERDTCFSSYLQHVLNFHLCNTCPLYNYMRTVHLLPIFVMRPKIWKMVGALSLSGFMIGLGGMIELYFQAGWP